MAPTRPSIMSLGATMSAPAMAQADVSKPLQTILRKIASAKLQGGRSRRNRAFRRHVKVALRLVVKGRYLKAAAAVERAIGYRRIPLAFIAEGLCYELAGRLDLAVQTLNRLLRQVPKGKLASWAKVHIRSLRARIASAHDVLGKWARMTSFSNVRQSSTRPVRYLVRMSPRRTRSRKSPWSIFVQYGGKNHWIMVYATVLPKVGKIGNGVPKAVLLWMLNFDSRVPGSKFTLDKGSGNLDVQMAIPKAGANTTAIDAVVHDVFLTADSLRDKVVTMMRSGRVAPTPRGGDMPTQLPGSDLSL